MTVQPSSTLGDIVTNHPDLARHLERRGLDYCCGGGRTLADACAAAGLDADAVASELTAADSGRPAEEWTAMGDGALADHLVDTHHAYLWEEMPRLTALVDKITTVHGDRHPELAAIQRCYAAIRADLEPHLLKEEGVLFPLIRQGNVALDGPISVMLAEHDHVGDLLVDLRTLTGGYAVPSDGCASYTACFAGLEALEADTHVHIHKENNVLFPRVLGTVEPAGG